MREMAVRTYETIAYLLMLMLKESGKARFRLSKTELQKVSGRDVIKSGLIRNISDWMEGVAVILPLDRGQFVVISQKSLEGIPPMAIKNVLPGWKAIDIEELRRRVDGDGDAADDDD